jgi:hypothetical protein
VNYKLFIDASHRHTRLSDFITPVSCQLPGTDVVGSAGAATRLAYHVNEGTSLTYGKWFEKMESQCMGEMTTQR